MPGADKIYADVISGKHDKNIKFSDLQKLLKALDFKCTIKGDHFIYRRDDTPIINIQPDGNKAKAYQVKQVRNLIIDKKLEA